MTLNNLTKQELLELIIYRGLNHSISIHDIKRVRYNTMAWNAKKMADEACTEMAANKGPEYYRAWKAAGDKFDKAMKLYDESTKFIKVE